MLRYITGLKWNDRLSSGEVPKVLKECGLNELEKC